MWGCVRMRDVIAVRCRAPKGAERAGARLVHRTRQIRALHYFKSVISGRKIEHIAGMHLIRSIGHELFAVGEESAIA